MAVYACLTFTFDTASYVALGLRAPFDENGNQHYNVAKILFLRLGEHYMQWDTLWVINMDRLSI